MSRLLDWMTIQKERLIDIYDTCNIIIILVSARSRVIISVQNTRFPKISITFIATAVASGNNDIWIINDS